ncbi:hypothetical protein [Parasegetibacter sp. NRK P23]|uniref:hypothetical protein n=1 Tax=Parasegetibacter sp. NRK P23 TaxID=2942999 RepID=UPI0020437CEE|nr:hypothetical protein [Parasegetibacter sp. NRK P23]MCM5528501.1 hypothetical protein [Parasegetibacter sp. NRK P23]
MKYSTQTGLVASLLMIVSVFLPWIYIESKDITVTGLHAEGTNFGRPAYMNLVFTVAAIAFFLIPKVWAKRYNFFFCGANLAWSIRNLLIMNVCYAGECPELKLGIILAQVASAGMLIASLFPAMKLPVEKKG